MIAPNPSMSRAARSWPGSVGRLGCRTSATAGCAREPAGELGGVGLGALDPQRQRAQPAQREPHLERARDRAVQGPVRVQAGVQVVVVGQRGAQHHVAVPREVLGHRVHDDVRAALERALHQRGGEGVVDADQRARRVRGLDQRRAGRRPRASGWSATRPRASTCGGAAPRARRRCRRCRRARRRRPSRCRRSCGVAERDLVGVPGQRRAGRPAGRARARRRSRPCRSRRRAPGGRALERAERLLERVPRVGVDAAVQRLAGAGHAARDERRGQHERAG